MSEVLALGMLGAMVLLLGGVNKLTVVVGPFLILATLFSLLRQTGRLSLDPEVPCLVCERQNCGGFGQSAQIAGQPLAGQPLAG